MVERPPRRYAEDMHGKTLLLLPLIACGPEPPGDMVALGADDEPAGRFWIDAYEFPNRAGDKPLTYTDLSEAETACAGVGKRLCTAAEWPRSVVTTCPVERFQARAVPS